MTAKVQLFLLLEAQMTLCRHEEIRSNKQLTATQPFNSCCTGTMYTGNNGLLSANLLCSMCRLFRPPQLHQRLHKRLNEWKENVESKGMRVNMIKTKVVISGERQMVWQKAARWPCRVCNKGVGSNSLQCTSCQKWVHKNTHTTV